VKTPGGRKISFVTNNNKPGNSIHLILLWSGVQRTPRERPRGESISLFEKAIVTFFVLTGNYIPVRLKSGYYSGVGAKTYLITKIKKAKTLIVVVVIRVIITLSERCIGFQPNVIPLMITIKRISTTHIMVIQKSQKE
jgi:hypothetical protein